MKKQSMYRYQGHENDGVDGFLCLDCFKHFSMRSVDFGYCPYCGAHFTAEVIRNQYYSFTLSCSDYISEWRVESAIKWEEDSTDLNWTEKGYTSYGTPLEALHAKQHREMDEAEDISRYEENSGKKKRCCFEVFRVARHKRIRHGWEEPQYKMSDFAYYKRLGKHITTCTHPNFINQGRYS